MSGAFFPKSRHFRKDTQTEKEIIYVGKSAVVKILFRLTKNKKNNRSNIIKDNNRIVYCSNIDNNAIRIVNLLLIHRSDVTLDILVSKTIS